MLASTFQNWNRRGGADPFASFLFAPGPESLVILKVIGYAGAARPKGRAGEPLPVLGIRVDGDSDIGERSFAVVTGDSCEAQPTIALQKQRTGGLEPSSVNGSIANPLSGVQSQLPLSRLCLLRDHSHHDMVLTDHGPRDVI
jgi:hypothetical protein